VGDSKGSNWLSSILKAATPSPLPQRQELQFYFPLLLPFLSFLALILQREGPNSPRSFSTTAFICRWTRLYDLINSSRFRRKNYQKVEFKFILDPLSNPLEFGLSQSKFGYFGRVFYSTLGRRQNKKTNLIDLDNWKIGVFYHPSFCRDFFLNKIISVSKVSTCLAICIRSTSAKRQERVGWLVTCHEARDTIYCTIIQ